MPEQEFNAVFSKRLKYYINKYDMTQSELAKRLGVSTQSVTNWCKGAKSPRMDKVDAMCDIFHCKRSDLMEDKSTNDRPKTVTPHFDSKKFTELIEKYKELDDDGKETVDFILNKEYKRCTADYLIRQKSGTEYIIETTDKKQTADRFTSYLNAAHADDYANAPEELKQLEEDMMDDENF